MGAVLDTLNGTQERDRRAKLRTPSWSLPDHERTPSWSLPDHEPEMDWMLSTFNWMLSTFNWLQEKFISPNVGSSTSRLAHEHVRKINDYVYEVCKPAGNSRPYVEIVFFHGFQLEHSSSKNLHVTTWVSRNNHELWLKWLVKEFPNARVLTISYDAYQKRMANQGVMDLHVTRENLVHSFTGGEAQVGQDGCPVVLVGHSFGGLVMKALCVQAHSVLSLDPKDDRVDNLLLNIKGFFTYASPNQGSTLADNDSMFQKGFLFKDSTTLNKDIARLNETFRKLRKKYDWKVFGIGESHEVILGKFKGIVVPEASARHDVDGFYTVVANHFEVCKPINRQSDIFQRLSQFIATILRKDTITKIDLLDGIEVVGLDQRVEKVLEKLVHHQHLGLVGIGGVGKTTLAKVVFNKISGNFEYTCFFREAKKEMAKENDREQLRRQILPKLKMRGRDVDDWAKLQGKRVLIVLDDIEFESQAIVMTEMDAFAEESRVIVTSRNSRFLQRNFHIHQVGVLDDNDSNRLFCLHAFDRRVAPKPYEDRVTKFVKKCGGLPLALKVSGRYLHNQESNDAWDGALENLRKAKPLDGDGVNDGLWSILEVSYNSLATSEREMFLDVATSCFGAVRDDGSAPNKLSLAQSIWRVCSWGSVHSGWQNLLDRCLVSEYTPGGIMEMHEVLRDLGTAKAGQSRLHIAVEKPIQQPIQQPIQLTEKEKESVKVLTLHRNYKDRNYYRRYVDAGDLSGLKELEILFLDDVLPNGDVSPLLPKLVFLEVSFRYFEEEIMQQRALQSLQSLFGVQSIRSIILRTVLSIPHLPSGLCLLSRLERLEIIGCSSLVALPVEFGKLQGLCHLFIERCWSLKELPDSFAHLDALDTLEIHHCGELEISLSCLRNLRVLRHLEISECKSIIGAHPWYELSLVCEPSNFNLIEPKDELSWALRKLGNSLSFEELDLVDAIGDVGDLHIGVHRLNGVYYCGNLTNLPTSMGRPQSVRNLEIKGWTEEVMHMQNFQQLHDFTFKDSDVVQWAPTFSGQLLALKRLTIINCNYLETLPQTLGDLPALQHLIISDCKALKAFPSTLGHLQALMQLEIHCCESLEALPDTLRDLQALQHLKISYCRALKALPCTLGHLQMLTHLQIYCCESVEALPDTLGNLQALQHLKIYHCTALTALPYTLGHLQALAHLEIRHCDSLDALPDSSRDLQALQLLAISYCNALKALPSTLGHLQALKHLEIHYCESLEALPNTFGDLQALQTFGISHCRALKAFPYTLGHLQALTHLGVDCCESLEALPDTLGDLQALQHMKIFDCRALKAFPCTLGHLQALMQLEIHCCESLDALPETLGDLQALQYLKISNCKALKAFPCTLGHLQALTHLEIHCCESLDALPDTLGDLQALQHLGISDCKALTALPCTLGHLQASMHLEIFCYEPLEALPDTLRDLQAL